MIALLAASAIYMSGLQAGLAAPTDAFRGCLREAASKAKSDKITGDGIEAYLKKSCTAQMSSLTDALVAFRVKNGMTRKSALSDAAMTVDDYVATPADNYKFIVSTESKPSPATATSAVAAKPSGTATPAATPAVASTQPPKP